MTVFSSMEAIRKWHNIFQVLREKNCHLRIIYSGKISFSKKGDIMAFSEEEKQRICCQQIYFKRMAKETLQTKRKQ